MWQEQLSSLQLQVDVRDAFQRWKTLQRCLVPMTAFLTRASTAKQQEAGC